MSPFASCGHHFFSKGLLNYLHQYHIVGMIALKHAKHNRSFLLTEITVKGVSRLFQGYSKHFIRADQRVFLWCSKGCYGCFEAASRVFQDFSRELKGMYKSISRVFKGYSKVVLRLFQGHFKSVPSIFNNVSLVFSWLN